MTLVGQLLYDLYLGKVKRWGERAMRKSACVFSVEPSWNIYQEILSPLSGSAEPLSCHPRGPFRSKTTSSSFICAASNRSILALVFGSMANNAAI